MCHPRVRRRLLRHAIVVVDTSRQSIWLTLLTRFVCPSSDTRRAGTCEDDRPAGLLRDRAGTKKRGRSTPVAGQTPVWISSYGTRTIATETLPFSTCPPTPTGFCTLIHYDRALINNAFIYDLSNQIGRYAVRTRFVQIT